MSLSCAERIIGTGIWCQGRRGLALSAGRADTTDVAVVAAERKKGLSFVKFYRIYSDGRAKKYFMDLIKSIAIGLILIFLPVEGFAGEGRTGVILLDIGHISGKVEDGMRIFLGIPYAAPPIGELRWKPPQKTASWTASEKLHGFQPLLPTANTTRCRRIQRGLPVPECLDPCGKPGEKTAGNGLDSRRRL